MQWRQGGDTFLKQWLNGTHARVGMKTALDRITVQKVVQRQETHALMMRHVGSHDHPTLAFTTRLTAIVHRFVVAIVVQETQPGQASQVLQGLMRRNVHRQKGGIGRDDKLLLQATFKSELRYAKGLVLIGFVEV